MHPLAVLQLKQAPFPRLTIMLSSAFKQEDLCYVRMQNAFQRRNANVQERLIDFPTKRGPGPSINSAIVTIIPGIVGGRGVGGDGRGWEGGEGCGGHS